MRQPRPSRPRARERLIALDVFRGITIAGMLLVNNPGTLERDLSAARARAVARLDADRSRSFRSFSSSSASPRISRARIRTLNDHPPRLADRAPGLLLNAFPFFWWGKIAGNADPTFLQRVL